MKYNDVTRNQELTALCINVRELVSCEKYDACMDPICRAMEAYPAAPQPHNLMGIVLEKTGNHVAAMKHFRAAWALDPTYTPANQNLTTYGTFYSSGKIAFDEDDCQRPRDNRFKIEYDARGVGHFVRRN